MAENSLTAWKDRRDRPNRSPTKTMPIKGLTNTGTPQFPKIGILRKGAPQGQGLKDLDYFRFDTKDSRADAMFKAAYGDRPTEIRAFLPYPTTDQNFDTSKEEYVAGGLKHRCDGEFCSILWQHGKGYITNFPEPIPCPGNCKQVGRLQIIIPDLERFAHVTAETHSINDIVNLDRQLRSVEQMAGKLNSIPFVLRRVPMQISTPNEKTGNRTRREKWMLSIEIDPEWSSVQMQALQGASMQQAQIYGGSDRISYQLPASKQAYPVPKALPDFTVSGTPFKDFQAWKDFEGGLKRCDTYEKTEQLLGWVERQIQKRVLPKNALAIAEREIRYKQEMLQDAAVSMAELTAVPAHVEIVQDEF